jgi:hypothetical protein
MSTTATPTSSTDWCVEAVGEGALSASISLSSLCWQEKDGLELVQQLEELFKENDALKQANQAHVNHTSLLLEQIQIHLLTTEKARLFNVQTQQQQQQKEEHTQKEQQQKEKEKNHDNDKDQQEQVHDHDNDLMVADLQFLKTKESHRYKNQNVNTQLRVSHEHLHELRSTVTASGCPMSSGCGGDEQNKQVPIMDDEVISSSNSISISDASEDSITGVTAPTSITNPKSAPAHNVSDSTRKLQDRVMDLAIHTAIMNTSIIKLEIDDHDGVLKSISSNNKSKNGKNKNKNNSKHAAGGDSLRASLHGMFMLGGGNKKKTNTTKNVTVRDSLRSSLRGILLGGSKSKSSAMSKSSGAGTTASSSSLRSSLHGMLRGRQYTHNQGGIAAGVSFDSSVRTNSASVTTGASDEEGRDDHNKMSIHTNDHNQQQNISSRGCVRGTSSSSSSTRRNREMAAILTPASNQANEPDNIQEEEVEHDDAVNNKVPWDAQATGRSSEGFPYCCSRAWTRKQTRPCYSCLGIIRGGTGRRRRRSRSKLGVHSLL